MPEQFKFPFKEKEDKEKAASEVFKGRMPKPEEDEKLTIAEGGKPTSEEKNKQAAKKAHDEFWNRIKDSEQRDN